MDELEEIRRRKLQELRDRQEAADQEGGQEQHRAEEEEAALERFLQQILDDEARTRLTRIRMSRPDFAQEVTRQLVGLAQSGRLKNRLTDDELRKILERLSPKDRDINIKRK